MSQMHNLLEKFIDWLDNISTEWGIWLDERDIKKK